MRRVCRYDLSCHADSDAGGVKSIAFEVGLRVDASLLVACRLAGDIGSLSIPAPAPSLRQTGLWQHTCFELFLAGSDGHYFEFNFSPSTSWAAYRLDAYRQGMSDLPVQSPPVITFQQAEDWCSLRALVDVRGLAKACGDATFRMALASVIEHADGHHSYWALAHSQGKPDFHHPDSFVASLTVMSEA